MSVSVKTHVDTFCCALPISMRPDWAKQMKHIMNPKNPQAELVTLIFPLVKKTKEGHDDTDVTKGPPYILSFPLVEKLLTEQGFECIEHYPVPSHLSHPARVNNEIVARWRLSKHHK